MPSDQTDNREQNKAIVRQMLQAWNQRGATHLVDDLISPHLVTSYGKPIVMGSGGERDRELQEQALPREGFPDQRFQEEIVIAEGNTVFVAWTVTGTHRGRFYGHEATGRQITVQGADIIRIEGQKIVEHRPFYGKARVHALARLGLLDERTQRILLQDGLIIRGRPSGVDFR